MAEEVVTVNNISAKVPSTTEGMMVAYGSLVIMTSFPIFVCPYRFILAQQKQKETQEKTGEKPKSRKPLTKHLSTRFLLCFLMLNI